MNTALRSSLAAVALACAGPLLAAEPDWGKVPAKKITVFYPGVSPVEWILKGTEHGGARGIRKGEACTACHEDEVADMGKKMASGQKLEPRPIKGKASSIPVSVQAAHDGANLYLRFSWKQPPASGGAKMDAENPVKLAFMLEENKVTDLPGAGCWATCHEDARTMPGAKDDKRTKYVTGGALPGKYFDLVQWKAKGKPSDGHVATSRVNEGGKALVAAAGRQAGDTWTVTFTRRLAGGDGDVALAAGKTYNFGFAVHDDHATGRFHHVSLGYTLGLDNPKADVNVVKQ
jgi:hypothetical protein